MSKRPVANPLALAVLSCLWERPMYPYEMTTNLRERGKEDSIRLNFGSLYAVIKSLEKHGLIVATHTEREGNRPERIVYEDVISYPALNQDLAFAVPEEVPAGALVAAAREAAGPELREARIFDVYRGGQVGEGRKSIAMHVTFQSQERTLTDEDAAALRERIVEALGRHFGAELRA